MDNAVLAARELRWNTRIHLAQSYASPILSVTFRAPSTLRREPCFLEAFDKLCSRLEGNFAKKGLSMIFLLKTFDAEGPARHYTVENTIAAKRLSIAFEDDIVGGSLLDIDLMDENTVPLSRRDLGLFPRACLVCGNSPAALCITGRKHPLQQTEEAFKSLMQQCLKVEDRGEKIARCAVQSLLYEVSVTPKPGLVDRVNSGAHHDMDYYTFLSSSAALAQYFFKAAGLGLDSSNKIDDLLPCLRPFGLQAEAQMNRATGGVNTHRGLIFSLGILCAAAGRAEEDQDTASLCLLAARIAQPCLSDPEGDSHGHQAQKLYGSSGARGEAAAGFPTVQKALPILEEALAQGRGPDAAGLKTLLFLMAELSDTNVLYRAGQEGLDKIRQTARDLLSRDIPENELKSFCSFMNRQGISPGGSADLLALCFFLHFIRNV